MTNALDADADLERLTSPRIFVVGMTAFLVIVAFVVFILFDQIVVAFKANPGLNGLIIGVLLIGALFAYRQVFRLFREIRWVNALVRPAKRPAKTPRLLAPMAKLLNAGAGARGLSTGTIKAILDSVGARLDEGRELNRYLTGLLVFLGLLGTFWGLQETVHSIGGVIDSMKTGTDSTVMFDELKNGLSKPIGGMSVSFVSSLFGLGGSLILGFLDLQAGQAQTRFYTELEDFLAAHAEAPAQQAARAEPAAAPASATQADLMDLRRNSAAMASLAEGIQGLVTHMRQEQQLVREWVESQAAQAEDVRRLLRRLLSEREPR
jgi:hypothetical protein